MITTSQEGPPGNGSGTPGQVVLFGDLSSGSQIETNLFELLHIRTNPVLEQFFREVAHVLRKHIATRLSSKEQTLFPMFTSLVDLVARLVTATEEPEGAPVLGFCLLTVYQVAQFILHYSQDGRTYPSPSDTPCVVGYCAGGFAAAAVSSTSSLLDLIPIACDAVLVSFSTALCSFNARRRLLGEASFGEPWSVCLPGEARGTTGWDGKELREVVRDFCESSNTLDFCAKRQPPVWISATAGTGFTTISGRPDHLKAFASFIRHDATSDKNSSPPIPLRIYSPYHAAHLFNDADVEEVMSAASTALSATASAPCLLPLMFPTTGDIALATTFAEAIQLAVRAVLVEPMACDQTQEALLDLLKDSTRISAVALVPFTCDAIARAVSSALSPVLPTTVEPLHLPTHSSSTTARGRFDQAKLAIVGYSGRFPSAASNEAYWALLRAGRDVHREIPADRFDWRAHHDPTGRAKNTSRVRYGCFIDAPGAFDTRFFNMSPREAENTDPAQRLAIMAAYEALEMGGIVRNRTPSTQQDRVGVFFGTTSDDWREVNSGQDVDTYFIPGGNRAFVPGRISYFFRFTGPSLSFDTACSSSFAAIQAACAYLWKGDCDTAVAGGTNVLTNPDNFAGLDKGHFLSTTGNCNAFDDGANGYCRADAVGAVVLKRLEDAEADNDPIFGVIVGANTNHSGHAESITRPHEGDQASVFRRVMRYANYDPLDLSYIEMHGTGTQAGDATEMNSVLGVFRNPMNKKLKPVKTRTTLLRPLYLGSAKANIGHAESASGVASLVKVLMMMKHSEIPPHVGIKTKINHNYPEDLAEKGVCIARRVTSWTRPEHGRGPDMKRSVFLNNFSAAGGNTAILLEDAPLRNGDPAVSNDARITHIVTLTAKSKASLANSLTSFVNHLKQQPSTSLSALSYTTTARRMHHNHRLAVTGSSMAGIIGALEKHIPTAANAAPIPPPMKTPTVIFMFSGQGTLYQGLANSLYTTNAEFRRTLDTLDRLVVSQGFATFLPLVTDSQLKFPEGDILSHFGTVTCQLALVAIQLGLADLLTSWGIHPTAVIGHSLGEYAALYSAGVLSAADALYLVATRATLLQARCTAGTHTMLAIKSTGTTERDGDGGGAMEKLLSSMPAPDAAQCDLACANQPSARVLAGPVAIIAEVQRVVQGMEGVQAVRLQVPYAFHTAQVDAILTDFEGAASANGIVYRAPRVPVVSPLLGRTVPAGTEGVLNASYLTKACRQVVNFQGALESIGSAPGLVSDKTIWLEIGVHPACCGMVKGTLGAQCITVATLRKDVNAYKSLAAAVESVYLAGISVDWEEYHRPFPASHQVLELPMYAWDLKNYWIPYRNNFCLTKGDESASSQKAPYSTSTRLSPSLQCIVQESHNSKESLVVVESDLFDKDLLPILKGHLVNNTALTPSSLWADTATALARYMLSHAQGPQIPIDTVGVEVANVKVSNPLIASKDDTRHIYRVTAHSNWNIASTRHHKIALTVASVGDHGKPTTSHVSLDILITPSQAWLAEWKRHAYLITTRIEALAKGVDDGTTHKIKRGMAYKLFSALVNYSPAYRGMSEVMLDSEMLEAVSTVDFQTGAEAVESNWVVDPRWLDSLGHIAGFIMNATDSLGDVEMVFVNHGWDRMRIAETLVAGKTYRAYNRMQLVEKALYEGDTYVLDDKRRIIAVFEGVKFQGVPKSVLNRILPGVNAVKASKSTSRSEPDQIPTALPSSGAPSHTVNTRATPDPQPAASPGTSNIFERLKAIICDEVGTSTESLQPTTEFADLGMDSLLSLNVLSRLREELSLDLPPSLFVDMPTVSELQAFFDGGSPDGLPDAQAETNSLPARSASTTPEPDPPLPSITNTASASDNEDDDTKSINTRTSSPLSSPASPTSSSTLPSAAMSRLYGSPATATTTLILFPDGAGSATAYAALGPHLDPHKAGDIVVYGLNCPWLRHGAEMTARGITIADMTTVYVGAVVKTLRETGGAGRRPRGKLAFGGWSAGGVLAYEAARRLQSGGGAGEVSVDHLVLLDSPNPIGLQNPPTRVFDFFRSAGVFGADVPEWLFAHFEAFLGVLDRWTPVSMHGTAGAGASAPPTTSLIVFAKDGLCQGPGSPQMERRDDDPRELVWLLDERTDFSGEGWASLVPGGKDALEVKVVEAVNHFSMMREAAALREIGAILREFIL